MKISAFDWALRGANPALRRSLRRSGERRKMPIGYRFDRGELWSSIGGHFGPGAELNLVCQPVQFMRGASGITP
jgi:hypothetical protein